MSRPILEFCRGLLLTRDPTFPQPAHGELKTDVLVGMRLHSPTCARQNVARGRGSVTPLVAPRTKGFVPVMGARGAAQNVPEQIWGNPFPRLDALACRPCRRSLAPRPLKPQENPLFSPNETPWALRSARSFLPSAAWRVSEMQDWAWRTFVGCDMGWAPRPATTAHATCHMPHATCHLRVLRPETR